MWTLFSMCHINIRSTPANLGSLEVYLQCLNFDFSIIGISETWLSDNNCDLFYLNGYNLVEKHRSCKKGGGVGLFINKEIPYVYRCDRVSPEPIFESLYIEIDKHVFQQQNNIILGVIYRPPNTDINSFNETLSTILETLKSKITFVTWWGIITLTYLIIQVFDLHQTLLISCTLIHLSHW